MTAVGRLTAFCHFRQIFRRVAAIFDKNIGRVKQITADILSNDFLVAVENNFLRPVEVGKADDNAMNVSFLGRLAVPTKSPVGKIYFC